MKEEKIKVRITKIARRTCRGYIDNCGCLLATSLKRVGYKYVSAYWDHVTINRVSFKFSTEAANLIQGAYTVPVSSFKPFTVTLLRSIW